MSTSTHFDEAKMLHPMTLVQRFIISIPPLIILLYPVIRSPNSADYVGVFTLVIYGILALPLIFLRYFRFRYRITPKEIIIQSGVLTRKHRSIPIERIQNIEIEQSLLPRLFGTAKVKIETAGSAKTEGMLEFVGIDTAHAIRDVVRTYQRQTETKPESPLQSDAQNAATDDGVASNLLFSMSTGRVFLAGMLRFSLLYIALAFSLLQQLNPNPDEIELWLTRGWLRPLVEFAVSSPALLTLIAVISAALLSWFTGILVSLNKYYGFKIWLDQEKLHKRHGLLTLSQGTIPISRVQALILRANLLMRRFNWVALEVQTMGLESSQQGHQVAAPLARKEEAIQIASHLFPMTLPETFQPVSRLIIRRTFVRYFVSMSLLIVPATFYWKPALWGLALLAFVPIYAMLTYKNHGYALVDDKLIIRRGVFKHYIWIIPVSKFQVLYASASVFQRRLGLQTVYIDTAGAGGWALPEIIDLTNEDAEMLLQTCYQRFQQSFNGPTWTTAA